MRNIANNFLVMRKNKSVLNVLISISSAIVICYLDYASSYEYPFTLLYLGPVALITISRGKVFGLCLAMACTAGAITAYSLTGKNYPSFFVCAWDFFVTYGVFSVMVITLDALLSSLMHEETNARIDHLTGLLNRKSFFEIAETELLRCRRYDKYFNLLFLDLDNFKTINDTLGHDIGDHVLQEAARSMREVLRSSDKIFRLGGDEFVILVPEVGQDELKAIADKIQEALGKKMQSQSWPVTCSLGALSCSAPQITLEQLLAQADHAMYTAKRSGKGGIVYVTPCG